MAERTFLFTDFYQLTMAQLYFRQELHETRARFEYWFRRNPDYGTHQAGYGVFAGLDPLLEWMSEVAITPGDLAYLAELTDAEGRSIFGDDFLEWLEENGDFSRVSVDAVAEGRVVHPNVPLAVVEGPLAIAQILETPLLNQLNHETLIATKASRVVEAARGRPVMDFGLRRAPGAGAGGATRAALIAGVGATSNVEASRRFGTRPAGTHAHSMVQAFMAQGGTELDAFRAYAAAYPDGCLLLVDTVDTLRSGVPNAITVFEELREKGHEPVGIRLDSGDLAYLAAASAKLLDNAGFGAAAIVLSSSLDELAIFQILSQIESEARRTGVDAENVIQRLGFGVGSRMIASKGQAYLDGVYKLAALAGTDGWQPAFKLSDSPEKAANPGAKAVWRLYDERGVATADVLAAVGEDVVAGDKITLHHPTQRGVAREVETARITRVEALLEPVFDNGKRLTPPAHLEAMRERRVVDLERLDSGVRRLINPHVYHVSLSDRLWQLKTEMVDRARGGL